MKKITVTRASLPEFEEYIDEIKDIWDTHWLTNMGVKHKELEKKLADFFGISVENIALFVNGHQALECIIEAMELGKKENMYGEPMNEVITTPYTFASTTHALVRKGLKPVFCDINPRNYTIDTTQIEKLVTDRTCAILPVHVYGNVCDVDMLKKIAYKYNLKLIYDGAHAFGVRHSGKSVASFGDATMFSFHATKVFNTIEGGAVVFKDAKLKPSIEQWKNFGILGPEDVEFVGGNAKMNEFCAAMGLCNLRNFDKEIKKRKIIAERYCSKLKNIDGIICNKFENEVDNYSYFPVLFDEKKLGVNRDYIFEELQKVDIYARKYFYPITSAYACYSGIFDVEATPIAKKISEMVLTLPIYPEMENDDIDRICYAIEQCVKNRSCN